MAKFPEPGKVKTRLCPPLTPGDAADLYKAFLLDTVELTSAIPGIDMFIAYDPDTACNFFSRTFPGPTECIPQGTGDLGARLSRISRRLFFRGYRKLIILASDTPHLPGDWIPRAFSRLDETDVILGPCDDGGYYLIGSRVHAPALFGQIPWSTSGIRVLMHCWTYLGPTTQWTLLVVCAFCGRLDIYLWGIAGVGNLLAILMMLVQRWNNEHCAVEGDG